MTDAPEIAMLKQRIEQLFEVIRQPDSGIAHLHAVSELIKISRQTPELVSMSTLELQKLIEIPHK